MKKRPLISTFLLGLIAGSLLLTADESGRLGRWIFAPEWLQNNGLRPASGKQPTFSGRLNVTRNPEPARIELSGQDERILVGHTSEKEVLPARDISVEAWVRVDRPSKLGGIMSAVQDDGDFERGWVLGFVNSSFSFALCSETTKKLTYLTAPTPFETNRWYHLAGTYDGTLLRLYVNGQSVASSLTQSGPILYPTNTPIVIGAYQDQDEHYRLSGALTEVGLFRRALTPSEVLTRFEARQPEFPEPSPLPRFVKPTFGPFVDWNDRTTATVSWETDTEQPTQIELQSGPKSSSTWGDRRLTRQHSVQLTQLLPDREYRYNLVSPDQAGTPVRSRQYLFDTSFYYQPCAVPSLPHLTTSPSATRSKVILKTTGVHQGYCLLFGATNADLAIELVRQSEMDLILIEPDLKRVQALRQSLDAAGVQGVRATVQHTPHPRLSIGSLIANLIVMENGQPPSVPAVELHRLLRPSGGTWIADSASSDAVAWSNWLKGSPLQGLTQGKPGERLLTFTRPRLPGSGDWAHQYGNADNSSCSRDEWVKGELQPAWWGDPGPRPMPDRGNRNPAPLSVNGRLFIQGDRLLFGLDAYNGSILWSFSCPEIRRANVTRDCSNMSADKDTLFVAHGPFCLGIAAQTGRRSQRFSLPPAVDGPRDWGFLAVESGILLGSRVKRNSSYLGDDGEWYEEDAVDQISRVTSDLLFALDPVTGKTLWNYSGGAILNSTVTLGDGMIFFLESRNPEAIAAPVARQDPKVLTDQWMVALDLKTGRKLWQKDHDFSACKFMTYLVYAKNTVVVTGTDAGKNFHTFAFNAPPVRGSASTGDEIVNSIGGRLLWSESHKEGKGHHSGHLQHPVVIGDSFYSDQRSFNMVTGALLRSDLPERRGCGVMSAAQGAIFFRHHFHSMWDLDTNKRTQFEGIRSGCWLSMIPAGGMLLAPETSAGCSCTHAIQTSIGYIPKSLARH